MLPVEVAEKAFHIQCSNSSKSIRSHHEQSHSNKQSVLLLRLTVARANTAVLGVGRVNWKRKASVRDFHRFRVTWITLALAAGVLLELVQRDWPLDGGGRDEALFPSRPGGFPTGVEHRHAAVPSQRKGGHRCNIAQRGNPADRRAGNTAHFETGQGANSSVTGSDIGRTIGSSLRSNLGIGNDPFHMRPATDAFVHQIGIA
jgi:hypothetical protein